MRRHKYFAKASTCHEGHKHPSKAEAVRCDELHLLQACGQIAGLRYEPEYKFEINGQPLKLRNGQCAKYKPDFYYIEGNKAVCEDVKGFAVRDFPLRSALFRHLFPEIELRVVS